MAYRNIEQFDKSPRNIKKEDAKLFLKNTGNTGKWILILFLGGIGLSIITLVLYFLSICPVWCPIAFAFLAVLSYVFMILIEPSVAKLNSYPLAMGYVLMANNALYDSNSDTQRGSLIIFTKDEKYRLDAEKIRSIGERIINHQIEGVDFIHEKMNDFASGKSLFYIDIPKPIEGVKLYCSYVILENKKLPNGRIPESRLIPCLVDEKNRGIAVPYKFFS